MKRILVTGATGGLGGHAVDLLLERGCAVHALGRDLRRGARLQGLGASFTAIDLATVAEDALRPVLQGVDAVWHCAARAALWGRHADFMADNCEATVKLARASAQAGVQRFVFVSTPAVYFDFTHRYEVPEHFRPMRYVNSYAYSKAMAEQELQRNDEHWPDMRVVVLRPRAIVGPYDQSLLPRLERLKRRAGGRLPLPRGGEVKLDLTYSANVVDPMWLATTRPGLERGAVFNITNHGPVRLCDALQMLAESRAAPPRIVNVPARALDLAARASELLARCTGRAPALTRYGIGVLSYDMTLCNERAKRLLGYAPRVRLQAALAERGSWGSPWHACTR
ncbi:NAD-dependent epimerase/dehydratase family protein [Rugamonas aquatica]|uniref:NAD-dependent epimerase/dehydratase family protein n=1 Tax=Rugamonas aquatica TaxID=2743357 RepID=A0A6A7N6V9_9BURK|nr:NAD-dependent epimerase/dehydratase family protein [Rugamonas aquatica]MQA40622.1 NAD-dependent epimerase/dehydratase family protein [Rugamonas aquatica]